MSIQLRNIVLNSILQQNLVKEINSTRYSCTKSVQKYHQKWWAIIFLTIIELQDKQRHWDKVPIKSIVHNHSSSILMDFRGFFDDLQYSGNFIYSDHSRPDRTWVRFSWNSKQKVDLWVAITIRRWTKILCALIWRLLYQTFCSFNIHLGL